MCDDNYGTTWSIDHVIPLSKFDFKDETSKKIALGWYNTRPILCKNNSNKFTTIDKNQLKLHLEKLNEYKKITDNDIPEQYIQLCATHLGAGNP